MKHFTASYVFVQSEQIPELIKYLVNLGYGGVYIYDLEDRDYDTIFIINGSYFPCLYEDMQKELAKDIWTDCGTSTYIFKQLAAMSMDTEINQWFIHKSGAHLCQVNEDNKTFEIDYMLCNDDPEIKAEDFNRATQQDLYDYFKRCEKACLPS